MSEAERLANELDDTPNWQKEKWGSQWKHSTLTYSRVPFEAAAELRRLSAELEKVRKDAERYRWLRDIAGMKERDDVSVYCGNDFDDSIDAAMKGTP